VGARTDAARAEVLAAREGLEDEVIRLEAAGRSAVDIPAKVRRNPVKTAGAAAGAAFFVLGGPGRLFRRVKRAVVGPEKELPTSILPDEVEKALRKLGDDGEKIRGTLEREFAHYLEEHKEERENRNLGAVAAVLLANVAKPLTAQAGRRLAQQLFSPEGGAFNETVQRIRARREAAAATATAPARGSPASAETTAAPPPRR
jgi:hypothetical protein